MPARTSPAHRPGAQYSAETRAHALDHLIALGGNIARASRDLAIPADSLRDWWRLAFPAGARTPDVIRAAQAGRSAPAPSPKQSHAAAWASVSLDVAGRLQERLDTLDPDTLDPKGMMHLAITGGIASDKHLDYSQGRRQGGVTIDQRQQLALPPNLTLEDLKALAGALQQAPQLSEGASQGQGTSGGGERGAPAERISETSNAVVPVEKSSTSTNAVKAKGKGTARKEKKAE